MSLSRESNSTVAAADWSLGSTWHRWDPHLHAPGTLQNDLFGGDWEGYIQALEQARPPAVALGVTEYFCLRSYKKVLKFKQSGHLKNIQVIFPNIELRLTVETRRGGGLNLHLIVCPDDPKHVEHIERALSLLRFTFKDQEFQCTESDLQRLGRAYVGNDRLEESAALAQGANQFKISWKELRDWRSGDAWRRKNVLIAVASGEDGLGGIGKDASFAAERQNIGDFADIIFSAHPNDIKYWGGAHPDFVNGGRRLKPCLHGSDAHALSDVLAPAGDRLCWIRSEPTFDGFRQILVEPLRRVYIGPFPPERHDSGDIIRTVTLRNAPWSQTHSIALNDGLVTVIGARGSGKTALADLIAFAACSEDSEPGAASFVAKAYPLLGGLEVELTWANGAQSIASFPRTYDSIGEPQVRYLSQQFVERLCSADGIAEPLIQEIESVVFSAIPDSDRMGCITFRELRDLKLRAIAAVQETQREVVREQTVAIASENANHERLGPIQTRLDEIRRLRAGLEAELKAVPQAADDKVVGSHQSVFTRLSQLNEAIASEERTQKLIEALDAEVGRQVSLADREHERVRAVYTALLTEAQWELLRLRPDPRASSLLDNLRRTAQNRIATLRRQGLTVPGQQDLSSGLDALIAEEKRLSQALGVDRANVLRRADLNKRLNDLQRDEAKQQALLTHCTMASTRRGAAGRARLEAYEELFEAICQEESTLGELYAPLHSSFGQLQKLSLHVQRRVDLEAWVAEGERLVDLRRLPYGKDGLGTLSRGILLPAWKNGNPQAVREMMTRFIEEHAINAVDKLLAGAASVDFGSWLFSTDHIRVEYGLNYEGVPLSQLSPGTRGVVLLTLYLSLDQWDTRPLVIDQPEENLDPKSVYSELVPYFREAARRRQIIMVTHNANLVVNTDSDQVIVTTSVRTSPDALPNILYTAGGLEDNDIRTHVCALLEGGEDAFRKRGLRYGVQ